MKTYSIKTPEGTIKVPSVTSLLEKLGFYKYFKPYSDQSDAGRAAHLACQLAVEQRLDRNRTHPYIVAIADGFLEYVQSLSSFKPIHWELTVVSQRLYLGGTLDLIAESNGELVLYDLKTGRPHGWHKLQLGLYALLLETELEIKPDKATLLYIQPYKTSEVHLSQQDFYAAKCVSELWQWMKSNC